jgi:hypothetical protein
MRQAVVVIHGIGEQRPMDAVRGFVKAGMPPKNPDKPRFWSKPDPMSEIFVAGTEASPDRRAQRERDGIPVNFSTLYTKRKACSVRLDCLHPVSTSSEQPRPPEKHTLRKEREECASRFLS